MRQKAVEGATGELRQQRTSAWLQLSFIGALRRSRHQLRKVQKP
jgi:hypothetical protein